MVSYVIRNLWFTESFLQGRNNGNVDIVKVNGTDPPILWVSSFVIILFSSCVSKLANSIWEGELSADTT
jgi:competence transcription factor ComK